MVARATRGITTPDLATDRANDEGVVAEDAPEHDDTRVDRGDEPGEHLAEGQTCLGDRRRDLTVTSVEQVGDVLEAGCPDTILQNVSAGFYSFTAQVESDPCHRLGGQTALTWTRLQ